MKRLTVYSREECPLCEELLAELVPYAHQHGIALQVVDVDSDPLLLRRYGLKVPMVDYGGETVAIGHLDLAVLEKARRGVI